MIIKYLIFILFCFTIKAQVNNTYFQGGEQFKAFFQHNKLPQCYIRPDHPRMPRSYFATADYFNSIPPNLRIPPSRKDKEPEFVPECGRVSTPSELNDYEFQTEHFLTALGCNIYDGSMYSMAVSVLGLTDEVELYEKRIIQAGETCEFGNVRADARCEGVVSKGHCEDKDHNGACGFCYGDGSKEESSLDRKNAWTFRMISDYWAVGGTVDARCPEKQLMWTWNDYKPILGENSWANLVAPLQVAIIKYKTIEAIPVNDISIQMAIDFLPSLQKTLIKSIGAVYYSPKNVFSYNDVDVGYDVSTENNISLLSGLKMLREVLSKKGIHLDKLALINELIDDITRYIRLSYDPTLGYFRQGGKMDVTGKHITWNTGPDGFAVDCQTWAMTVVSPLLIDQWFGAGTAKKIWLRTKEIGGYKYNPTTQLADGVGFTHNELDQVFSGEWTYGAINMLKTFENLYSDPSFGAEAKHMSDAVARELFRNSVIDGKQVVACLYANKRYYIPFGWWANPLLSTASTGWAVLVESNYNPFYLGGAYRSDY